MWTLSRLAFVVVIFSFASLPLVVVLVAPKAEENTQSPLTKQELKTNTLPLCYASKQSRLDPLEGKWVPNAVSLDETPYANLSCPFEWTMYGCFRQEQHPKAEQSATTRFVPRQCRLPKTSRQLSSILAQQPRKVVLYGDSLTRQLFQALGCRLHSQGLVSQYKVVWAKCNKRMRKQPVCPKVCVKCGRHSYSNNMNFWVNGTEFQYINYRNYNAAGIAQQVQESDIVLVEGGAHGDPEERTRGVLEELRKYLDSHPVDHAKIIYMVTWHSNFATERGLYDPAVLEVVKQQNTSLMDCVPESRMNRMELEYQLLKEANASHNSILSSVEGVLYLRGIDDLGHLKIGAASGGEFGDCQHFCMPGPPDDNAIALETMILQMLTEGT